ncbi:MAG: transglycosylase domain-containing protein, partial [Myxococcales bacterium]|nr:transglycosylase domain-containing protein [Myxococcales bacterium]
MTIWMVGIVGVAAVRQYGLIVARTDVPERIDLVTAGTPSTVHSARGFAIGGLERGGAEWVSFDELSPAFVRALVASEDAHFFQHYGFDLEGIARAARVNLAAGGATQGGSTLTQQLAKSFVGDERTLDRKLSELAIARAIEARFAKPDILAAYANRAYFGAGAEGIGAAARLYFGLEPSQLDVARSALLVAMLPAPARSNPFTSPDIATERRGRVLDRMLVTGLATRAEVAAARAAPLGLARSAEQRVFAPGLERATWRELDTLAPDVDWRHGGRQIDTRLDLVWQRRAESAVREHLLALDRRQGYRGALGTLAPAAWSDDGEVGDAARELWRAADPRGELRLAVVTDVAPTHVTVWAGSEPITLGPDAWSWAVPWRADARNHDEHISTPEGTFARGDLVVLQGGSGLAQLPIVEAAFASMDLADGTLQALVGGFDAERSDFDRATQGCRQPGSTFKPIVYSAALDAGYTAASLVRDGPVRIELGPYEEWRPRNADGGFEGPITLWETTIWSRNIPVLGLASELGLGTIVRRARELGLTTPLDPVESLPLGASCTHPVELLTVYSAFARGGFAMIPHVVARTSGDPYVALPGPWIPGVTPLERVAALMEESRQRPAIRPTTAWQIAWLLREVVRRGTAADLATLPYEVAGKTGTTNTYDAWFAGYDSRDVSVLWIGADTNLRPLGRHETGGRLALPAWRDAVLPPAASGPVLGELPRGLTMVDIEPESGLRAPPDRWSVA